MHFNQTVVLLISIHLCRPDLMSCGLCSCIFINTMTSARWARWQGCENTSNGSAVGKCQVLPFVVSTRVQGLVVCLRCCGICMPSRGVRACSSWQERERERISTYAVLFWVCVTFLRPVHTTVVMHIRCTFNLDSTVHTWMCIVIDAHQWNHLGRWFQCAFASQIQLRMQSHDAINTHCVMSFYLLHLLWC